MIIEHQNGSTLIKFEKNNIGICMGGEKGCGVLMFYDEKSESTATGGTTIGFARTADFPVSITFSGTEYIDALISSLKTVKKVMEGRLILMPLGMEKAENIS